MEIEVVHNEAEHRYEIRADGELAGVTVYRERPGLVAFMHTEVDPDLEGHGVGSQLIRSALDDARERKVQVLPFCPFVNGFIERHAEYADLVPAEHRPRFGL